MFIIWKSEATSLSYAEIAVRHAEFFGGPKKKDVTVRGIIYDIRQLEKATGREYLQPSGGKPERYKINRKTCVDLQWTAIILLELHKGYKHIERQISRNDFEQYLVNKYGWDQSFISGRIDYTKRSNYISFYELEAGKQFVEIENRLEHDLDYLRLIVEDYHREQLRENPTALIITHLENLLALYRSDETPTKAKGDKT